MSWRGDPESERRTPGTLPAAPGEQSILAALHGPDVPGLLERAVAAGVRLEVSVDGELLWSCQAGTPPEDLLREIRRHRSLIVATLRAHREAGAA